MNHRVTYPGIGYFSSLMWRLLIHKRAVSPKTHKYPQKEKEQDDKEKKLSYTSKKKRFFKSNGYLYIRSDVTFN